MMEKIFLIIAAIGIIALGLFLVFRPGNVGNVLKKFYSKYPIIKYAGEKQLTSQNIYVVILGIVFLIMGSIGFISIIV